MGALTTHVLDTAQGKPAVGVGIRLLRIDRDERHAIITTETNADGRCDGALLEGVLFAAGTYELVFAIGRYFAGQPVTVSDPPFLDEVSVRFTVSDATAHYHIPLLISPWSYTTYRGS